MKKYTKEKLSELKRADLVEIAKKLQIKNYSRKKKTQLISAIIKEQDAEVMKTVKDKKEKTPQVSKRKILKEEMEKLDSDHKEFSQSEEIVKEVSDSRFDLGKIKEHPSLKRYEELPDSYGDNKIVLLVRDPQMIMAYWELTPDFLSDKLNETGLHDQSVEFMLRLNRINGSPRHWDYPLYTMTRNYYIEVPESGKSYQVDFGVKTPGGDFVTLIRSNIVNVPRETMSSLVDEQWMTLADEESFRELYQLSGGETWRTQEGSEYFITGRADVTNPSSGISSFGVSEWAGEKDRGFFLNLNAELTVTGETDPEAEVFIAGEKINLNSDGTFSLKMNFPDGTIKIPVEAVSPDKVETRTIEPTFYRITRIAESIKEN